MDKKIWNHKAAMPEMDKKGVSAHKPTEFIYGLGI